VKDDGETEADTRDATVAVTEVDPVITAKLLEVIKSE